MGSAVLFILRSRLLLYSAGSGMRFISLLLMGLCPYGVYVIMLSSLVCLSGCRITICGCGGCCDGDECTVVCVACVYAERV